MRVRSVSFVSIKLLTACLVACVGLGACSTGPESEQSGASQLSSDELTLADVQRALNVKESKTSWTAGETSVSHMSAAERKMLLGVPLSELPEGEMVVKDEETPNDLPAAFDWRNVEGVNYVSPMMDQGRCGSCVAFSAVATFETQLNIAAHDPTSPWQLSPQYLFACGGGGCGFGWFPGSAAKFFVQKGVPDQACMPYVSGAYGTDARCNTACSDAPSRSLKATAYTTPSSGASSMTSVKRALMNGPLMASMTVYDDFMFYTSGVYKHVTGNRAGGHAVSIVGWDDTQQAWIVRNSWGTGWGMKGFFMIAYNDVSGVGRSTYGFEVPPTGPYVAISELRDKTVISGQYPMTITGQSVGSAALSWTLTSGTSISSSAVVATGGAAPGTPATIDTTAVADGVYTLQPHAQMGNTKVSGPPHSVYVLNGTLTGDIKFKNLAEGATLSGTPKWDLLVGSAPVPATHVEWTITNAAGEVIVNRTAGNPGPLMQLGWNTTKWPNGNYVIKVTGGAGTQLLTPATVNVTVRN